VAGRLASSSARRRAARARERGKEQEREKEKGEKEEGGKRGTWEKGRERGGCVGGIRGDDHERGVEHAARHVGRGTEKGWRLIFGCQTARRWEMFWVIKSSDGRGF
jgi:hypothetical protein